ncbi:uncharacterized protein LOC106668453 isoform X2 [Cimex lectularius]|uniref:Uncharacterized protein n=1 Tax=Cimex lectularius TaxID=79782 RepID=A0A8I6RW32_CIMLE|nr:uncharacterized protein LOC106668453 isoform X2 [Cimex lectularius]
MSAKWSRRSKIPTRQPTGLYVHSSPPTAVPVHPSIVRQWLRGGEIERLMELILQGEGATLVGEYSPDSKTRAFINSLPRILRRIEELHEAGLRGQVDEVDSVLSREPRFHLELSTDSGGLGLLHKAVIHNHVPLQEWLIENYPDTVHVLDKEKRNPLHYAGGCVKTWNRLVEAAADTQAVDSEGNTPAFYMLHPRRLRPPLPDTRAHKQEQGLVIKPSNIRIWIHDKDLGRLQRVLWEGMGDRLRTETSTQPMVRRFLNAVPYIMGSIREVHTAAVNNDLELLLARSAEPVPKDILMSKDANGLTPLHKAAGLGNMEIVQEILRRAPEAVNAKDNIGRTPLHYAAGLRDRNAMYQHLVDAGAIDHLEDKKGNTPSHYKGKPSELEGPQYLSVIPNAPRTAHIFPPSWDWRLLTTSSDAETASTATSPQIETIRNINDEKITKEEEELAPKIDDDEEMEQASETPEVESEPVLDPETAQSEPAEAEAMRPEMSEDEGVGSEFPASAGDTLSPESDVTNEEDVREDELSGAKLGETFTLTRSLFGGRGHRGGNLGDYDSGNEDVQTESEETFGEKINHDFVEDVGELNESDQIGILELNERRNESSSSLASQNNEIEDIFKRPTSGQRESISRPISGTNIKMSDEGENSRPSSRQIEGSPSDSIREQMGGRSNIPLNGQMEGRSRRTTRGSNSISLINGPTTGQIARTSSRPTGGQMEGSSNGSTSGELVEGISGTPFRERMNSSRPSSGQIDERSSILIRGQSERDSDRLGSAEGSSSEPINGQVEDSSNIPISEQMESSTDRPTSGQMEGSGPFSGRMENSSSRPISGQMEGRSSRPISGQMENSSSRPISGQMEGRSSRPISGQFEGRSSRPISGQLDRRSSRTVDGEMEGRSSRPISGSTEGSSSSPISGQFESNSSRPTSGQIGRSSGPINAQFEGTSSRLISGQINSSSSRPVSGQMDSSLNRPFSGMMEDSTNGAPLDQRGMNDTNREGSSQSRETSRPTSTTMNSDESRPSSTINQKESSDVVNDNDNDESEDQDSLNQNTEMISRQIDNSTESNPNTETESRPSISGQSSRPGTGPFQANGSRSAQGDSGSEEEAETPERVLTAGGSRAEILAITPAPPEVGEDSDTQKAVEEQISEEEKQLAEELVKTGDMEAMAEMVLAGQGSALLGLTSDNPDVQLFINNVPQYMAKIERVHKAAREGDLRGVQTSLDRRKFAVARDNSTPLKPTPLHVAALFGRTSVLRYLAGRFPETMHAQDSAGRSPLHYAATLPDNGHFYSLLVTLGADKSLADDAGKTAEDYLRNRAELTRESLLAEYQNRTVPVDTSGLNFNRYADKGAELMREGYPIFNPEEGRYLANSLGEPLIKGLTEVAQIRPRNPVSHLAHFLLDYNKADNEEVRSIKGRNDEDEKENENNLNVQNGELDDNKDDYKAEDNEDEEEDNDDKDSEPKLAFKQANRDEHGQSMVHFAAARSHGRNAIFQLLQEMDINIGLRDGLYRTARDIAEQLEIQDNVQSIDKYVVSIAARGEDGKLQELILEGYDHILDAEDEANIMDVVTERGLESTIEILKGITSFEERREKLHRAIRFGSLKQVNSIFEESPNKKDLALAKNQQGRCSLHVAVLSQNEPIVEHIANRYRGTLHVGDNLSRTPLHYAMGVEKVEPLSRILIAAGAQRVLKDLKGRQPSYYFMNKTDIQKLQDEEDALRV